MRKLKLWVFIRLWRNNATCKTCGANEWHDQPEDLACIRLRFTKRFLTTNGRLV